MRYGKRILFATVLSIAICGLVPSVAFAGLTVSSQSGGPGGANLIVVGDSVGEDNSVVWTLFTPAGGSQDIVLADTTAGIADPIPDDCARIDGETIRCPSINFSGLVGGFGSGPDSLIFNLPGTEGAGWGFTPLLNVGFGSGNDSHTLFAAVPVIVRVDGGDESDSLSFGVHLGVGFRKRATASATKRMVHANGGGGRDAISGGPGGQVLRGGAGADQMKGGKGSDRMFGGGGPDAMFGGPGVDFMYGNGGRDFIRGGGANDHGTGGAGDDNVKD